MSPRVRYRTIAPGGYEAMLGLERYLHGCGLEASLIHLVKLRASQLNGCAYCIDMHWKDLRAIGEGDQRLSMLDAWDESPFYTERERAALLWTEAVTRVADNRVPDEIYDRVKAQFSDKELADLTYAIATINAWNRLNVALRTPPGSYQPPKREPADAKA
jgi:AhpD family alkylhydroperoxidase